MIANEQQTQQEEEEKEETSTVDRRNIRSKRRIENIETDNVLVLDRIEAKMIFFSKKINLRFTKSRFKQETLQ
jgi:hypothetical protein